MLPAMSAWPKTVPVAVACVVLWAGAARAQDFVGARALGLGEAYRSIASGNDGLYANPAGITALKRYAIEVHYGLNLVDEQHIGDLSIVDSKTSPFAVGVAYTFDGAQFTKRATVQHTATLAMAYPFLDQMLSVGLGFKYVNVTDAFAGNYLNALAADVGVLSRLPGGVSLAAVGYNLVPIKSARIPWSAGFSASWDLGPLSALLLGGLPTAGLTQTAAGVPRLSVGELRGPLDGLTVAFDWNLHFATLRGTQSRMSGGLEYLLADMVPIRAGYLWNQEDDDHRLSVGAGFIVPFFGLDVGFQQSLVRTDERLFACSLKFFPTF